MSHETRISKLEQARKEMEDALLVMAQLETRQSQLTRELAENAERDRARIERAERRNEETDARISQLVSAIGELIARLPAR
jgi:chromosome segregation ATPase